MIPINTPAAAAEPNGSHSFKAVALMYYLILFVGVILLLTAVGWFGMARRRVPAVAGQPQRRQPVETHPVARALRPERQEDKPCLTPIDCVEANRCAGHCGTRR